MRSAGGLDAVSISQRSMMRTIMHCVANELDNRTEILDLTFAPHWNNNALYCISIGDNMAEPATTISEPGALPVNFETHPSRYRHWRLTVADSVATLTMDVNEEASIRPGYRLKLNSYDLGVDIELHESLQRIRFEYPEVG